MNQFVKILESRKGKWMDELKSLDNEQCETKRTNIKSRIDELEFVQNVFNEPSNGFMRYVENEIKSFMWIQDEINRIQKELGIIRTNITAQYGIEASMPKPQTTSNSVLSEVVRREKRFKYLDELKSRMDRIERSGEILMDTKQRIIFENMLNGVTMKEMIRNTGIAKSTIFELKKQMIREIAQFYKAEQKSKK